MSYAVGSLVSARGREWVVLPESTDDMLVLRPLGGADDEIAGILTALEEVKPATFTAPRPEQARDHHSARLLRDALRLGFRASAGPFRSFGRLGFEPRPYQLVPLLMALRLDPVRLLVADDVGIGKTVEAGLVARELLDQGEVQRLCVLCPPHLAEQWQRELRDKFHLEAELVLPSTAGGLERTVGSGQNLFDLYPITVVSTDFIKSDSRRADFVRSCPELVIVDEAHACAAGDGGRGRHQRHDLVRRVASDPRRHVILVTATPHSGKPEAFRSLCTLLDPAFADLPDDLSGAENAAHRRRLARHLVQRRRGDLRRYLDDQTTFPDREEKEEAYTLAPDYRRLFDRVLEYARETVLDAEGGRHRQRVRWWSALALLRSLASSPAAAAATLRTRAAVADTVSEDEADEVGRQVVLDLGDGDEAESADVTPGGLLVRDEEGVPEGSSQARLRALARDAEALRGDGDAKLLRAVQLVNQLLDEGFRPIVFCRFIATAEYVAAELGKRLKKGAEAIAVTSTLPAPEREEAVAALALKERRVLVATDCLSEGINLQEGFDAVIHYDLSWNPTRHEQREGRVDRFGQPSPRVRLLTYYGKDNPIDGIVLDVLVRKSRDIRRSLGVTVPFPAASEAAEAIVEGVLLRRGKPGQTAFEFMQPEQQELFAEWDRAVDREKRSRTVFAQESLDVEEVRRELQAVRTAVGSGTDVRAFFERAVVAHGGVVEPVVSRGRDRLRIHPGTLPAALVEALDGAAFTARFEPPIGDGEILLGRTHPRVERLAAYVLDRALDERATDAQASRCGVIRTAAVERRTTLLLLRYRMHLVTQEPGAAERRLVAEDAGLVAFAGAPESAEWLAPDAAEALLSAEPASNMAPAQKVEFLKRAIEGLPLLAEKLAAFARARADELLDSHRRVRRGARVTGVRQRVEAQLPPDVLGVYVFLPRVA